jgi:streptomycin 6-kinase
MDIERYMSRWDLAPDGNPVITRSSHLLPVRYQGLPAMLKIATHPEEQRGAELMQWWAGDGAARVLALDGPALLVERATGLRSLITMAASGSDDHASQIICAVAARLHAPRSHPPTNLVPLADWFRELWPTAAREGGILLQSAAVARTLLADQCETTVLHGDLHHGNVLDFGERGWLAIDPKGLIGDRAYDFANIFCNPDHEIATSQGRLARQVAVVAETAGLDRQRLLHWILAYAGLSAAWSIADGTDPETALQVAVIAAACLNEH